MTIATKQNPHQCCRISVFVSKTISRAGFDGFAKLVSDLLTECTKLPNPKQVLVTFRQIKCALNLIFDILYRSPDFRLC